METRAERREQIRLEKKIAKKQARAAKLGRTNLLHFLNPPDKLILWKEEKGRFFPRAIPKAMLLDKK